MDRMNKILTFWFGYIDDHMAIDTQSNIYRKWFNSTPDIDQEIRDKFEKDLEETSQENLDLWLKTARGCLALVVLFDQLPRNMYRKTPKVYSFDPLAIKVSLFALKQKLDRELRLIERQFLYMPLMHSELLELQEKSVDLFTDLLQESAARKDVNLKEFQKSLKYAQAHRDIIKRFGRFPHRNSVLGRNSTPEEKTFLMNNQKM